MPESKITPLYVWSLISQNVNLDEVAEHLNDSDLIKFNKIRKILKKKFDKMYDQVWRLYKLIKDKNRLDAYEFLLNVHDVPYIVRSFALIAKDEDWFSDVFKVSSEARRAVLWFIRPAANVLDGYTE